MREKSNDKRIMWYSLALMAFTSVWGFGNVINGFAYYNGLGVVIPWILILVLYFIPYALMVGELGSAFKNSGGGVSSWIQETFGRRMAFYAGWTYWVVHMPYLSQKPTSALIATGWIIFRDGRLNQLNPAVLQLMALALFAVSILLALRGVHFLEKISSIAGTAMFILSMLFILMMIAAPAITDKVSFTDIDWSLKTFLPKWDAKILMNISILVLAVGGCEKLSPYVNQMDRPAKQFPRSMITLAVMVAVCAVLGTIALGMMYDSNNIPSDFLTNGSYEAFRRVGEYYHLGDTLLIIYAIGWVITNIAVIIISIDAPLRMLLASSDRAFIPDWLTRQNKRGVYKNGVLVVAVIVSVLIIIPALGIGNVNEVIKYVIDLNSVCMPLRYLWVFLAYIMLKKAGEQKFPAEYRFVKGKKKGMAVGFWCFFVTAYACIAKIFNVNGDMFKLTLNILTPFILLGIGLILPAIARRTNQ